MGALHIGHMSLVELAKTTCDYVVLTIFVNPMQFNRKDDLEKYPRPLSEDIALCAQNAVDIVFTPDASEMYPDDFTTKISVGGITELWEGEFRPGHFDGVATVVTKLLLMALPDRAFFGEKDFQQLMLIQTFVRHLNIPCEIIGAPTFRETDGLAFSSRNRLLSEDQRKIAPAMFKIMTDMAARIKSGTSPDTASQLAKTELQKSGFEKIDYIAAVDPETLQPLPNGATSGRILCAAWLGGTRLIDNFGF